MALYPTFYIRIPNFEEVLKVLHSNQRPFEEYFISELQDTIHYPIIFKKEGYFDPRTDQMGNRRYVEYYAMTLDASIKYTINFGISKQFNYFFYVGSRGMATKNDYLLFSTVYYLLKKLLSIGCREINLEDICLDILTQINIEEDIDTFFSDTSYLGLGSKIIDLIKVPFNVAAVRSDFPEIWR
ncbi:hypothetical protein QNI19_18770 [Cytophagaceae bacterium DM2B3-1]|uniref:Uncharacterized protein n=1 Tax=Xanthocytophaga flava TaxID=3048013 RepID=A0ABT7CMK9_9BACT|nr:hypothetical protein [Xanthocytophaga flavus]MDJ1494989.1 hypothetical protein [Xanthocytophaga flavus]